MTNAVASSSSKRAQAATHQSALPAKRQRVTKSQSHDAEDVSDDEHEEGMDEHTRAKIARKEARTIRNRESAQRSRNQRKAHLSFLEARVAELEAENRALRSGATPPSPRSSTEREPSPAQSTLSIANDLGIPPEIVNSSGGVTLASVAPPPADLDVKPHVAPASPAYTQISGESSSSLEVENANLKQRVNLLENIVRQLATLSSLAQAPTATEEKPAETLSVLDWGNDPLGATLSPPLFPSQPVEPLETLETLSTVTAPSGPELNLACHPAVMATSPSGQALQRARTNSISAPLEMSMSRLRVAAKVIIALAKLRGMSNNLSKPTPLTWTPSLGALRRRQLRRSRMDSGETRRQWRKTGMRG